MKRSVRLLLTTGIVMALGAGLLVVNLVHAADEDKEVKDGVLKLAAVVSSGNAAAADAQAKTIADKVDDIEPVMDLMKPRKDGGLGVGAKPGSITPDGIEKKIIAMDKKPLSAAQVNAEGAALGKMADEVAAIAAVAQYKCPVKKKEGDKDPKDWKQWSEDMHKYALDLSKAAKAKNAAAVKKSVAQLNEACNNCHSVFK
ncbi:MAG TPA: cytochrome c [Gemmataceae bacterium]|nr:cytochrome c [Gemmataceae bacterium]